MVQAIMNNGLTYLQKKNLTIEWLVDQRQKYHLSYEQIGKVLGIAANTTWRLCCDLGIESENAPAFIYTNAQLLSSLEQGIKELGYLNFRRYDEWADINHKPRAITIQKRFLKFEHALKIIGKQAEYNYNKWSDEEIKHHLLLLNEKLGRVPTGNEITNKCPFSESLIEHRFGSISVAFKKLDIKYGKVLYCPDCDKIIKLSKYNSMERLLRCKNCNKAKRLAALELWSSLNPQKVIQKRKLYYLNNREEKSNKHKKWYKQLKIKAGIGDTKQKVSQNIIAHYISEFYPSCTVIQEETWPWLINPNTGRHLFVDIYVPELRMVVEYHGIYHYEIHPPYIKTEDELQERQKRDVIKKELCEQHNIRYIEIPCHIGISKSQVYSLLHMVYIKHNSHVEEFGVPYNRKPGDIGYDLHASHDILIAPNQHVNIGTEIFVDMPFDIYASILLRSSMAKRGLMTHQSLIDPGFRGELKLMVWNFSNQEVQIEKGERIAQILFGIKSFISLVPKLELNPSERSDTGWGSSGK